MPYTESANDVQNVDEWKGCKKGLEQHVLPESASDSDSLTRVNFSSLIPLHPFRLGFKEPVSVVNHEAAM